MAASKQSLVEDLNDKFLQCAICMETYKSPRMLPCIHSFCLQCLEKLMESSRRSQPFSCPTCRRVVAIPTNGLNGLPNNFLLVSLMDRLNLESTTPGSVSTACYFCEGNQSIHLCLDCSFHVCTTCRKFHDRIPDCRDHTLIPIEKLHDEEYTKRVLAMQAPRCTEHRKEKLRFYCTSCNKLVCRDCAIVSHQGHTCVEAEKNVAALKEEFTSALRESGNHVKSVHEISSNITLSKEKVNRCASEEERKVNEYYDTLVKRLTSDKDELLKNIRKIKTEQEDRWKKLTDDLTNWQKAMKNTEVVTKKIMEANNQWDILVMGKDIKDAIKTLHGEDDTFKKKYSELRKGEISGIKFLKKGENKVQEWPLSNQNVLGVIKQFTNSPTSAQSQFVFNQGFQYPSAGKYIRVKFAD